MNKFEQLIEYVINDEEQKARELFHDIVVAKSREIYENIMAEEAEEDLDEAKEEDLDEAKEEDLDEAKEEDLDEAAEEDLDEAAEEMDEGAMGGDASDDLIDEVETEEESDMNMEGEGEEHDFGGDEGGDEPVTKDDILNLEDKLDQLMAEFEDLMADAQDGEIDGDGDDFGADEGGDAIEMDDTEEFKMDETGMMEAVSLKAAPKPVTSEEGGVNKKSSVAANAGAKGPIGNTVKPVRTGGEMGGKHDSSAYSNTTKDLIGKVGNTPAQSTQKPTPATKPHLAQATGVNTKSPVAKA